VTTLSGIPLIVGSAVFAAAVGVLWPRVAYRLAVPLASSPRDACVHCGTPFPTGWRGWIRPGRPCGNCEDSTTAPWWLVSILAGAAAAALSWRWTNRDPVHLLTLSTWLVVVHLGGLLSMIDLAVQRLPTWLVLTMGLTAAALIITAAGLANRWSWVLAAGVAAAAAGGAYLALALLTPSGIGAGDVRLAAVLGLPLGTGGVARTVLGATLPYVFAVPFVLRYLTSTPTGRRRRLPFGPLLVLGALAAAALLPGH
jgi:leader peptidase (prepilin peptidase) / N-methyltransferase